MKHCDFCGVQHTSASCFNPNNPANKLSPGIGMGSADVVRDQSRTIANLQLALAHADAERDAVKEENLCLREAMNRIIVISDRDHDAWSEAKVLLTKGVAAYKRAHAFNTLPDDYEAPR